MEKGIFDKAFSFGSNFTESRVKHIKPSKKQKKILKKIGKVFKSKYNYK